MLIASSIVKVQAAKAEETAALLERVPGVTSFGVHRDVNIILVTEAHDLEQLEGLHKHILEEFPDVLGIFPSFVADEEALGEVEPTVDA